MNSFYIKVEITEKEKASLIELRRRIRNAINDTPGFHFEGIASTYVPDPFQLTDPDNPPKDFA